MRKRLNLFLCFGIAFLLMTISLTFFLSLNLQYTYGDVQNTDQDTVGNNTARVTFRIDDDVYETEWILLETLVSLPEEPEPKDGVPFLTWTTQNGEIFNPHQVITENIELTAKFSDNYLVTFYNVNGIILDIAEVVPGGVVAETEKEVTLAVDEVLLHWKIKGENEPYNFENSVNSSFSLYPQIKNTSQAVFITYGTEVEPQVSVNGFYAAKPEVVPKREGFTFLRWSATEGGTQAFNFENTEINGTVLIYAVWKAEKVGYYINYYNEKANIDNPGDPYDNPEDYELVYTKYIPATHANSGYAGDTHSITETFANAQYTSGGDEVTHVLHYSDFYLSDQVVLAGDGTSVINLYYHRMLFEFTFDLTKIHNNTSPNSNWILLADGTKYENEEYVIECKFGQYIFDIWPYEAGWDIDSRKYINWSGYFGNGQVTLAPMGINWAFNGGANNYKRPTTKSKTLQATYSNAKYAEVRCYYTEILDKEYDPDDDSIVSFIAKGGYDNGIQRNYRLINRNGVAYQTSNPSTAAIGWPGRTFEGFEAIGTLLTPYFQNVVYDREISDYTKLESYRINYYMRRLSYTFALVTNGGYFEDIPDGFTQTEAGNYTKTMLYQEEIELPETEIIKDNYIFEGWYLDENFQEEFDPGEIDNRPMMPSRAITLYAKFTSTDVTVNYYDGDELIIENNYGYNDVIYEHQLNGSVYASYQVGDNIPGKGFFRGWYYKPLNSEVMVEMDMGTYLTSAEYNLYAQWEVEEYTVTYNVYDDSGWGYYDEQIVFSTLNTIARSGKHLLEITTLPDYYFLGWNTKSDGTGEWIQANTKIMGDIEVYAILIDRWYAVHYDPGFSDMRVPSKYSLKWDDTDLLVELSREGYEFKGWYFDDEKVLETDTYGDLAKVEDVNEITLVAKWERVYSITVFKTVIGDAGDKERLFNFSIEFFNDDEYYEKPILYSIDDGSDIEVQNGKVDVQLKHGQKVHFKSLPEGVMYKISEEKADGYTTYVDPEFDGEIIDIAYRNNEKQGEFLGDEYDVKVNFYNEKIFIPPTDVSENKFPIVKFFIVGTGVFFLAGTWIRRRKTGWW